MNINNYTLFLVDASGVLYTDNGPVYNVTASIQSLQKIGPVIVITNNSSYEKPLIAKRLKEFNIPILDIISSGQGLEEDPDLNQQVRNKKCFVYGGTNSYAYITQAGGHISHSLEESDVIILTSSIKEKNKKVFDLIKNNKKMIPIICTNPDRYVMGKNNTLIPVIGYYGEKLEKDHNLPVQWFGKPHPNFAKMVRKILKRDFNLTLNKKTLFFDDNPENVNAFENQLGITGCLIQETGVANHPYYTHLATPTFTLPTLGHL